MSEKLTIRKAEVADAQAFSECHFACWREAYSELWSQERFAQYDAADLAEARRQAIESGDFQHYIAEADDGSIIGISIAGPTRDEDTPVKLELHAIYVRRSHQGSGVSDDLLKAAIGDGPATLWVYRDNPRASAFYINQGFIPDGAERVDPSGILEIRFSRR